MVNLTYMSNSLWINRKYDKMVSLVLRWCKQIILTANEKCTTLKMSTLGCKAKMSYYINFIIILLYCLFVISCQLFCDFSCVLWHDIFAFSKLTKLIFCFGPNFISGDVGFFYCIKTLLYNTLTHNSDVIHVWHFNLFTFLALNFGFGF